MVSALRKNKIKRTYRVSVPEGTWKKELVRIKTAYLHTHVRMVKGTGIGLHQDPELMTCASLSQGETEEQTQIQIGNEAGAELQT